ncbi:MAG: hypothetical protein KIT58_13385 [Planctomycetota bacterium]|nr:hypothetical protein [Planctomycetota bacterium]
MIGDLVQALDGEVGRVELRGLVDYLRRRWLRLPPGPARDATAADGRVLARAVERVHLTDEDLAAAVLVVRRLLVTLRGSDEVAGRPECLTGCADRLLLVEGESVVCALCDSPARALEGVT